MKTQTAAVVALQAPKDVSLTELEAELNKMANGIAGDEKGASCLCEQPL